MAWNDSGNGKDPWQSGGDKGPPDLDALVRDWQRKLGGLFGGGKSSRNGGEPTGGGGIAVTVLLLGLVVWGFTGLYKVDESERGVVLRFGEYVRTSMPGLRWHLPYPIEQVNLVNTTITDTFPYNARMLTQDENIVDVDVIVQYRREDPQSFLFNVREAEEILKDVSRSAIREVVGKNQLDFVLTRGRTEIAEQTKELVQSTLDAYGTGITVFALNLQDTNFPTQVEGSVQDAIKAREDKERKSFEAQAYANDIVPRARGEAARTITDAQAYRDRVIADAQGEAARFDQIRAAYEKAPEVTRQRLYLETLEEILASSTKVFLDEGDGEGGGGNLIYLPLDRLMDQRRDVGAGSAVPRERSGSSGNSTVLSESSRDRASRRSR